MSPSTIAPTIGPASGLPAGQTSSNESSNVAFDPVGSPSNARQRRGRWPESRTRRRAARTGCCRAASWRSGSRIRPVHRVATTRTADIRTDRSGRSSRLAAGVAEPMTGTAGIRAVAAEGATAPSTAGPRGEAAGAAMVEAARRVDPARAVASAYPCSECARTVAAASAMDGRDGPRWGGPTTGR